MKINIKATNLDLTPSIVEYIEEKISSVDKFLEKFEGKSEIEVFVEIARTTNHHRKGEVFRAEANMEVPGKVLRADHEDWDVRVAIDKVKDKLQVEAKKYKGIKDDKRK
jgi:putative sigma-54 modulation protein